MLFTKIITHDTTFHADDVFAVAMLLRLNGNVPVIRTRDPEILKEAINNPLTVVLDVGGVYDPKMLNFDHHQDTSLLSAAGLVFQHWKDQICPPTDQFFFEQFISAIDLIDTNRGNLYATWATLPTGFRNISSMIAGFNRDVNDPESQHTNFMIAVSVARMILNNELYTAQKKAVFEYYYSIREILPNNVAIFEQYSQTWKEKTDHVFAVMPHANGWQIQSRDTSIDVVPEAIEAIHGFLFRHKSGFMATVKDRDIAVAFAALLPEYKSEA